MQINAFVCYELVDGLELILVNDLLVQLLEEAADIRTIVKLHILTMW